MILFESVSENVNPKIEYTDLQKTAEFVGEM